MKRLLILLILINTKFTNAQSKFYYGDDIFKEEILSIGLQDWQLKIAQKEKKTILDYFYLLPKRLLEGELYIENDNLNFRKKIIEENNKPHNYLNIKNGYLIASPSAYIIMALFKDRVNKKDIIGIVRGCGGVPYIICDYAFIEYNADTLNWKLNKEVFPWDEFYKKNEELESSKTWGDFKEILPEIVLPEYGTKITVLDSDSSKTENSYHKLFEIIWDKQNFKINNFP